MDVDDAGDVELAPGYSEHLGFQKRSVSARQNLRLLILLKRSIMALLTNMMARIYHWSMGHITLLELEHLHLELLLDQVMVHILLTLRIER